MWSNICVVFLFLLWNLICIMYETPKQRMSYRIYWSHDWCTADAAVIDDSLIICPNKCWWRLCRSWDKMLCSCTSPWECRRRSMSLSPCTSSKRMQSGSGPAASSAAAVVVGGCCSALQNQTRMTRSGSWAGVIKESMMMWSHLWWVAGWNQQQQHPTTPIHYQSVVYCHDANLVYYSNNRLFSMNTDRLASSSCAVAVCWRGRAAKMLLSSNSSSASSSSNKSRWMPIMLPRRRRPFEGEHTLMADVDVVQVNVAVTVVVDQVDPRVSVSVPNARASSFLRLVAAVPSAAAAANEVCSNCWLLDSPLPPNKGDDCLQ